MSTSDKGLIDPNGTSELTALAEDSAGTTRTLSCRTVAKRGLRQEHHIRTLVPFGWSEGDDDSFLREETTPLPSEMLLAALGACLVIGIHANAVARAIPITRLELVLNGEMNFGALWGSGDLEVTPIGFEDIDIEARIQSDAPPSVLQALMDHVLLWSPVANSMHNPINLTATVADRPGG